MLDDIPDWWIASAVYVVLIALWIVRGWWAGRRVDREMTEWADFQRGARRMYDPFNDDD